MPPETDRDALYLRHMLECIDRIDEYSGGSEAHFKGSRMVQDATIRNLQTLAESSQRLSEIARSRAPGVPWRAIAGFRNILVHDYLGIDPEVIWRVVANDLPALRAALLRLEQDIRPMGVPPARAQ